MEMSWLRVACCLARIFIFVIPAKAGIHFAVRKIKMDPGFRRDDGAKSGAFMPDALSQRAERHRG